jgi:hypothetical protein
LSHINDPAQPAEVFAGLDGDGSFHQLCLIDATGTVLLQGGSGTMLPGWPSST